MELLQQSDDVAGDIDLVPVQAVKGRFGEGVVIVMPSLAQAEKADRPLIAALIGRIERPPSELVTHRVHGPGQMMGDEESDQAAPEKSTPPVDEIRNDETEHCPERERAADEDRGAVLQQVLGISLRLATRLGAEHPANMRVEQALERAVRIPRLVGESVVLPVRRDPLQNGAFDSHGAESEQHEPDHRTTLEAAMRGKAMEADCDTEPGEQVQSNQQCNVHRHDLTLPELDNGEDGCEEGNDDGYQRDSPRQDSTVGKQVPHGFSSSATTRPATVALYIGIAEVDGRILPRRRTSQYIVWRARPVCGGAGSAPKSGWRIGLRWQRRVVRRRYGAAAVQVDAIEGTRRVAGRWHRPGLWRRNRWDRLGDGGAIGGRNRHAEGRIVAVLQAGIAVDARNSQVGEAQQLDRGSSDRRVDADSAVDAGGDAAAEHQQADPRPRYHLHVIRGVLAAGQHHVIVEASPVVPGEEEDGMIPLPTSDRGIDALPDRVVAERDIGGRMLVVRRIVPDHTEVGQVPALRVSNEGAGGDEVGAAAQVLIELQRVAAAAGVALPRQSVADGKRRQ